MTRPTIRAGDERPSLLVARDRYPALRERQDAEPWATWAERAERQLRADLGGGRVREHCESVVAVASGAALCHALDRGDPAERADAVLAAIAHYDEHVTPDLGSPAYDNTWHVVVPPSGALFCLVVALDVVGPAVDDGERAAAEERLARAADWFHAEQDGAWKAARYGAYGVWAAYERDRDRLAEAAERTMAAFRTEWPDGVYREGCEYANNRFAGHGIRAAKIHFPDVLAHATDLDFYGDEAVREDFAWLFGYSLSPVTFEGDRDCYTFGDSGPSHTVTSRSSCAYRAGQFGGDAANNAAWAITGPFEGRHVFETYVLTDRVPSDPDPPASRVFPGGGAWLLADSADPGAPAGALWNPTDASGHSHPDVNAVHLCAGGEHVLRNAGYNGWGNGVGSFDWEYVHDRAVANNVVLTDYPFDAPDDDPPAGGHVEKRGEGITEGIAGGPAPIEYACGDSGGALPGATHRRSLVGVYPSGGANGPANGIGGYWVLFDEVEAPAADTVHTALHPATTGAPETVETNRTFRARIDAAPRTDTEVSLTLHYGAAPDAVAVREGALADWDHSVVGRYLYATYGAGTGERRLPTVLYPHRGADSAPAFESLAGDGYAGTRVDDGSGAVDCAVALAGDDPVEVGEARIAGRAALFRESRGGSEGEDESANGDCWFLRRGTRFERGARGLRADAPVSAAFGGGSGTVVARRPTDVTLRAPDAAEVRLDGESADAEATGDGGLRVTVPAGTHRVDLD